MNKISVLCMMLAVVNLAVYASEPVKAVGFFIDSAVPDSTENPSVKAHVKFIRDGKEYEAENGFEVFPGDTILTSDNAAISIAFTDNNAVKLMGGSEFSVSTSYGMKNSDQSQFALNRGRASFVTQPDGINSGVQIDLPSSHTRSLSGYKLRATSSTSSTFEVIVTQNQDTSFTANIALIAGNATLSTGSGANVDIKTGNMLVMSLANSFVQGLGSVSINNLTTAQIKTLSSLSVAQYSVTVNELTKSAVIKTVIKSPDGSVTTGTSTQINGFTTKDYWVTKQGTLVVSTWSEYNNRIEMTQSVNGYKLAATVMKTNGAVGIGGSSVANYSTVVVGTGANYRIYRGTTTVDNNGVITFVTGNLFNSAANDGSKVTIVITPGSVETKTITVTPKVGATTETIIEYNKTTGIQTTKTGTIVNNVFVLATSTTVNKGKGSPTATTPDNRDLNQNEPPKSH